MRVTRARYVYGPHTGGYLMWPAEREMTNVRPGRSVLIARLRQVANAIRTQMYFALKCPWVKRSGMVRVAWNVDLWSPHRDISLGDRVQFGRGCIVNCDATFGSSVLVARNVAFVGRDDHRIDLVGRTIWDSPRGDTHRVIVEDDVWIGHGAIIVAGIKIGRGAVVAAGSVVAHDVPRYAVVAGVPARTVRMRFGEDEIARHEALLGYSRAESNQKTSVDRAPR